MFIRIFATEDPGIQKALKFFLGSQKMKNQWDVQL